MDDCVAQKLIWMHLLGCSRQISSCPPLRGARCSHPSDFRQLPQQHHPIDFDVCPLVRSIRYASFSTSQLLPECLLRSPPLPLPRRPPLPPPTMAPTSVCCLISQHHAVATLALGLYRVRRPLLTLSDRYDQRCHCQRESTLSGASHPRT